MVRKLALTAKKKMFIAEYLIDLNQTQAAIRAGYSPKTANEQASRLLADVNIQQEIQKAMDERSKRTNITADKVLNEIAAIAFDDISNYLEFHTDAEGNVRTRIKDSKTINTKNISEVSCGKDGTFRFKLYCKDNALSMLGKHLKLFTDKIEVETNGDLAELLKARREKVLGRGK